MNKRYKTFEEVVQNDATIKSFIDEYCDFDNVDYKTLIVELANQKQYLLAENMRLNEFVPRKICYGNKVFIWHCPDELIPEITL